MALISQLRLPLELQLSGHMSTVFYLQLVGDKEHRLAFGDTFDSFVEDVRTHTSINCTQGIIQEKYGSLTVEGTSQAHSLTLPSAQVGSSLTNLKVKKVSSK